ncbi:TPA: anaerobic ribonucleoside-triphosphate reductase, partial [Enterococcus faecium]|nr:anaerobic ribonucleoside-triphosphate reductase [Enterococcus faecium]
AKAKTKKDIFDAMQSLEYEINTLFTSNGQTPFTSLGFGLGENWFEREIQKAILQIRINGLGSEKRTAIFPKLIFTLKKGVNLNPEDPNYDIKQLALECATKRMYPDILNYDKIVELTGSFKVPMGCRSFLQGWKDENGQEVNVGRMNLGVVTLNLPRIAIESKGDQNKFWQLLSDRLEIMKDALLYRVERCKEAIPANAPILYMYGAFGKRLSRTDSVNELFKNRRATVSLGYIGLYEVASAFFGGEWETNPEAKAFTLDIVKELKANADAWGDEYGYHFSVYSTPSESLTDRFCRLDTEKFGIIENITDKEYYTNSFHYDVRKNPTPFEKLEFEKDYPKYCSGGFIHYCEYPMLQQNPKALEAVWDFAYDKIGYLGTNTPIDHCYQCGFEGDFKPTERGFECPECGNHDPKTCDVVKRTCGYLGNPQARPMVHGRHKEISSRVKHMK